MFVLVNPIIVGTFKTAYDFQNPNDAAKYWWMNFSKILQHSIPSMYFTLQDDVTQRLYHYQVSEMIDGSTVNFTINPYEIHDQLAVDTMLNNYKFVNGILFGGGSDKKKSKDDDSSSTSSSESSSTNLDDAKLTDELKEKFDIIRKKKNKNVIVYYNYIPSVYAPSSIFVPTFVYPIQAHYVEIGAASSAFFG